MYSLKIKIKNANEKKLNTISFDALSPFFWKGLCKQY